MSKIAEYVASRGTTALGIIGTVLGGIGTAAAAGNLPLLGGNGCYQNQNATMHDLEDAEKLAMKDAEIARLNSERYSDAALASAKEFATNSVIDIYKELKADINGMKEKSAEKWTDQAVVNANQSNAITALAGQAQQTANLVAQITRTAVPQSSICNFGCGCNSGCGSNI